MYFRILFLIFFLCYSKKASFISFDCQKLDKSFLLINTVFQLKNNDIDTLKQISQTQSNDIDLDLTCLNRIFSFDFFFENLTSIEFKINCSNEYDDNRHVNGVLKGYYTNKLNVNVPFSLRILLDDINLKTLSLNLNSNLKIVKIGNLKSLEEIALYLKDIRMIQLYNLPKLTKLIFTIFDDTDIIDLNGLQPNIELLKLNFIKLDRSINLAINGLYQVNNFYLNNNKIKSIQHVNISNVRISNHVSLSQNEITKIFGKSSFYGLSDVRSISFNTCAINQIINASFEGLDSLESLDLSYNYIRLIRNFDLSGLSMLREIDLSQNSLESIDSVSFNPPIKHLKKLYLNSNHIKIIEKIDFIGFDKLYFLSMNDNSADSNLYHVELNGLKYLKELELSAIKFTLEDTITVKGLDNLSKLKFYTLNAYELDNLKLIGFDNLKVLNIDTLYSTYNQHNFKFIRNLSSLISLNCKLWIHNKVDLYETYNLNKLTIAPTGKNSASSYIKLELDSFNKIVELAIRIRWALNAINVTNSDRIESLEIFDLIMMPSLSVYGFKMCKLLRLRGFMQLNSFELYGLPNLQVLYLIDQSFKELNNFSEWQFKIQKSLIEFGLINSKIQNINKINLTEMSTILKLNLSYNQITTIDNATIYGLKSLKSLVLKANQIKSINNLNINGVESLESLDLSFNFISYVIIYESNSLKNLKYLNLEYNQIRSLDINFINLKSIGFINLIENSIFEIKNLRMKGLDRSVRIDLQLHSKPFLYQYVDFNDIRQYLNRFLVKSIIISKQKLTKVYKSITVAFDYEISNSLIEINCNFYLFLLRKYRIVRLYKPNILKYERFFTDCYHNEQFDNEKEYELKNFKYNHQDCKY